MNTSDLEKKATQKARTIDPRILPFTTSAEEWRTWVSDQGQWIFIEKAAVDAIGTAFNFDPDQAFQWLGTRMLEWLAENSSKVKPRTIWKFNFTGCTVNFGVFQNQCCVFMPRKI